MVPVQFYAESFEPLFYLFVYGLLRVKNLYAFLIYQFTDHDLQL